MKLLITTVCLALFAFPAAAQRELYVSKYPMTRELPVDWAKVINRAIQDAEPGDTVVLDWREQPYEIYSAITIDRDGVTLDGRGNTVVFAPNGMRGEIVDCIEVVGSESNPTDGVTVKNFILDANYWNQPGSHNPRGFDSDHATDLTVENMVIMNAFVGLTFGLGVDGAVARNCYIRQYFDDAFNASGDGVTAGANNITFENCLAEDARNESNGGPPGVRNNAWEIEDGAQNITVRNCAVKNIDGSGFAVRNHGGDVSTGHVRFENCSVRNVSGLGWHVFSGGYPNRVEYIGLTNCSSDSVVRLHKDIRGLWIEGCRFDAAVTLGPAKDAFIKDSTFDWLRIWTAPPPGDSLGSESYQPTYRFENCTLKQRPWILGGDDAVTFVETSIGG
ncbi:MAG: hypothetical protein AAGI17_04150 [Planctomycetota bacterium]